MDFVNRQQEIESELSAILSLPCPDATSQQVHDNLARFDLLYSEGHTKECGVGMVWGGKVCGCQIQGSARSTGIAICKMPDYVG